MNHFKWVNQFNLKIRHVKGWVEPSCRVNCHLARPCYDGYQDFDKSSIFGERQSGSDGALTLVEASV